MGLIKSALTSVNSTLHDQWEEYITCDSLDTNTLVVKKTTENGIISNKSRIQVAPGQVALIFDSGKILDATAEEGIYTFDQSSSPSLFAGQFGEMFKEMWERFKFNGAPSKEQAIFYINTKEIIGNKFGSSSPMSYPDPEYKNIYIRYFGVYSFRIADPFAFFSNVVGNIKDVYTKDELMEQANAEFVSALDVALQECAGDGIVFSSLPSKQLVIAEHMNEALDTKWKQLRGMEVVSVAIEKITPDDESRERIQKFDNASMYGKEEYAAGRMVDATATAMENAASNTNGAAGAFMGLGMMNGAMGGMNNPLEYVKKKEEKSESVKANGIPCPKCGSIESGNFCSQCGTKIEVPTEKYCTNCGEIVKGNFCSKCGTKAE